MHQNCRQKFQSMLRWLLLAACSISATADPSETCARVARAHLPQGPLIIKPQPNEVVIASSDDLLDEQSYVNANVNGYHTSTFTWPWPVAITVDLRLGTHVLEARLEAEVDSEIGVNWQARTPTSRITFDLVAATSPTLSLAKNCSVSVGNPTISAFTSEHLALPGVHRSALPANLANRCTTFESVPTSTNTHDKHRKVRVVLVGSLHVAGQNLLALEQAARLPHLCAGGSTQTLETRSGSEGTEQQSRDTATDLGRESVIDKEQEILGFTVSYLTAASGDGPLVPLLESAGVPLGRFELLLTADAIGVLAAAYAAPEEGALYRNTEGELNGGAPMQPEEAAAVAWLVAALVEGETGKGGSDLAAPVYGAVASLLSQLHGVHVLSFTNHETMVLHDRVLVECARLCGVGRILNEPGNLWWGKLPTIDGVHGLILPSQFAADFWQQQIRESRSTLAPMTVALSSDASLNDLSRESQGQALDHAPFESLQYFVINPGVDIPPRLKSSAQHAQSSVAPKNQDLVAVIGWFGRAEPQKSPGLALHLAAALKMQSQHQQSSPSPVVRTCLLVAGGGSFVRSSGMDSPLAEMATGLGLKVGRCPPHAADLTQRDVFEISSEATEDDRHQQTSRTFADYENGDNDWADVEFTGPLSHPAMLSALHTRVDVLVHTNVLEETFCMVNVEAMARAVPVVSYGVGGVSEYLGWRRGESFDLEAESNVGLEQRTDRDLHRNSDAATSIYGNEPRGLIVRPTSVSALTAAVKLLVTNDTLRRAMGKNARRFAAAENDQGIESGSNPEMSGGHRDIDNGVINGLGIANDMGNERMARQYATLYRKLFLEAEAENKDPGLQRHRKHDSPHDTRGKNGPDVLNRKPKIKDTGASDSGEGGEGLGEIKDDDEEDDDEDEFEVSWEERIKAREHVAALAYAAGGGAQPRAFVGQVLRRVYRAYRCDSINAYYDGDDEKDETCPEYGSEKNQKPSKLDPATQLIAANRQIESAVVLADSLVTVAASGQRPARYVDRSTEKFAAHSAESAHRAACALASVAITPVISLESSKPCIGKSALGLDNESGSNFNEAHESGDGAKSILSLARGDRKVALVAHMAAGAVGMAPLPPPLRRHMRGSNFTGNQDSDGPYSAWVRGDLQKAIDGRNPGERGRLVAIAQLSEATAAMCPRAQDAYRMAGFARAAVAELMPSVVKQLPTNEASNDDGKSAKVVIDDGANNDKEPALGALWWDNADHRDDNGSHSRSNMTSADSWDLAAEWYTRAALLRRTSPETEGKSHRRRGYSSSSSRSSNRNPAAEASTHLDVAEWDQTEHAEEALASLMWFPPSRPSRVPVELFVNGEAVVLDFAAIPPQPSEPFVESNGGSTWDDEEEAEDTEGSEGSAVKCPYVVGTEVWARLDMSQAQTYGSGAALWARPWYEATILHATSEESNTSGAYGQCSVWVKDFATTVDGVPSADLRLHTSLKVPTGVDGDTARDANNDVSNSDEAARSQGETGDIDSLKAEAKTIHSFCDAVSAAGALPMSSPSSSGSQDDGGATAAAAAAHAGCFRAVAAAVGTARTATVGDFIASSSPVAWSDGGGGAWDDGDARSKKPFEVASASKLRLDAQHFAFLARRLSRLGTSSKAPMEASTQSQADSSTDESLDPMHRLSVMFATRAEAFRDVATIWTKAGWLLGSSTADDSGYVYDIQRRDWAIDEALQQRANDQLDEMFNRSSNATSALAKVRAEYRETLAIVARRYGRFLFKAHAPALRDLSPVPLQHLSSTRGSAIGESRDNHLVLGAWATSETTAAVEAALTADRIVVVDNAFSPAMLAALRRMCDESTAFFDSKAGYHGGYLGDGLSSGAVLQASAAFRNALPNTLGRFVLSQIWAYKYDSAVAQGIRPHVDQGAYSVNCWLSPNHARDEPMHNGDNVKHSPDTKVGGLRLYRGPGVEGEALATALQEVFSATQEGTSSNSSNSKDRSNDDDGEILRRANQDFRSLKAVVDAATARGTSEQVDVAYKQNRCVLFESRLLHETSPTLNFRSGYRRRRINLTFMFGNTL